MSENPNVASGLRHIEALWDESFRFAQRVMERHAPPTFDSEKDRTLYYSHVPMLANAIYHDFVQASGFLWNSSQKDIDTFMESSSAFIEELRSLGKGGGDEA